MDYQEIKLKGGAVVSCDMSAYRSRCKSCNEPIRWAITSSGKKMPIRQDENGEWVSHFSDCTHANKHRQENDKISEIEKNQDYLNSL